MLLFNYFTIVAPILKDIGTRACVARLWLRVRGNGKNCDYAFGRAIIPEDSIGCGCALLGIRLKNLLSVRTFKTDIFMGLEAIMPRIHR